MEKNRVLKIKLWKKTFEYKCKSENWLYETLGRLKGKKTPLIAATFVQATTSLVTSQVRRGILQVELVSKKKNDSLRSHQV